jgi:predicted nuclease with TOPRIM domain
MRRRIFLVLVCVFPPAGFSVLLTIFLVNRIHRESDRLDSEEERAEEDFLRLQREAQEAQARVNEVLARLTRLRRQKRQLRTKGVEMAVRGLRSLDELEETEKAESEAMIAAQSAGAVDTIDWSAVGLEFVSPSDVAGGSPSEGVVHQ